MTSRIDLQALAYRRALDNLGTAVRTASEKKSGRRRARTATKPPRDPKARYYDHSPEQVEEANSLRKRITGEKDD